MSGWYSAPGAFSLEARADGSVTVYWGERTYSSSGGSYPSQLVSSRLTFDSSPEIVLGSSAANTMHGDGGNNWLVGFEGKDLLEGSDGSDRLEGGSGDDALAGGAGADYLDGGDGADIADYRASGAAVSVSLTTFTGSGGDAAGDWLLYVEHLFGSEFGDTLVGNSGTNWLAGFGGNDVLTGGAGIDYLDGGDGLDVASYEGSTAGVAVNLTSGTSAGGDAQGDVLSRIEHIFGSTFGDTLTGTSGYNWLEGRSGNDLLAGGAGGDYLSGGDGADIASYTESTSAVTVNLATSASSGGDAEGDWLVGIENLFGSAFGDTLTGTAGFNWLEGRGGDDVLIGAAGADYLSGGAGGDIASYRGSSAGVNVSLLTSAGRGGDADGDWLVDIEHLFGSDHADSLSGNGGVNWLAGFAGDDLLIGGAGIDYLDGGSGADAASYASSTAEVSVNLATSAGAGGDAEGDVLLGIEHVYGSAYGDILSGTDGFNWIEGRVGDDVLVGGAGADYLSGGDGVDIASYQGSSAGVAISLATSSASGGDAQGDWLVGIESLVGSAWDDVFQGNASNNGFAGGDGNDTFIFGQGGGQDLVGDFVGNGANAGDSITFQGLFTNYSDMLAHSQQSGSDVLIDFGAGNGLTLLGTQLSSLHSSDFVFM